MATLMTIGMWLAVALAVAAGVWWLFLSREDESDGF